MLGFTFSAKKQKKYFHKNNKKKQKNYRIFDFLKNLQNLHAFSKYINVGSKMLKTRYKFQ